MARKAKLPFDAMDFLTKANGGRKLSKYRKDEILFSQGDPADAVFYIIDGGVKVTVLHEQGKEAVVALLGPDEFLVRVALRASRCVSRQPRRWAIPRSCEWKSRS